MGMEVQGMQQLSLQQLADLDDGRIATAFDQAVKRAAQDCDDRPGDDRPRKVILEIAFAPVLSADGICDSVKSQIQIKDAMPTRKSRVYDFGLRKGGLFVYQPMALDNHRQGTFPMEDDEDN